MKKSKPLFRLFHFLLYLFVILTVIRPLPVYSAGSLKQVHIGFNTTIIEININPGLSKSNIKNGYEFTNSSSYDNLGVIPTSVSMEGIAVTSNEIVQDPNYPFTTKFTYVRGETTPDGIIKLHITATDYKNKFDEPLSMEVRFYDDKGLGQYEIYRTSYYNPNSDLSHHEERRLGWFDAAIISKNDKNTEVIVTIDLNGPVTGINVQTATQTASKNTGEDEGTVIRPDIVATPKPSRDGNTSGKNDNLSTAEKIGISLGGALAAAGTLSVTNNGKKSGSEEEEKKRKTYKMKVYKGFGDAIRKGADSVHVWARIVEIENGVEKIRDDLTAKISASGEGMNVKLVGMQNNYMGAEVSIPAGSEAETAILIFTFTGAGGIMHNRITFRVIGEPEIIFPSSLSEDGQGWIMGDEEPLVIIAGAGGTARKLFVLQDALEEPKNLRLKAEGGFEVSWEKKEKYLSYDAVIKNNSAPIEKEAGIFGEQESIYVRIIAEFPDGTTVENGFFFGLWPQGFTVLYSKGLENDIKNARPGQPAKLQDGRLDVRSYMEEGDKRGIIPYTAFDICYAVMKDDGKAQLYTEEKYFTVKELQGTDEVSKNVVARYNSHITTFDGDFNNMICTISPQPMNPELTGSYDAELPVRVTTPEKNETALIPLRLVGLEPGPPEEWTREYRLLLDAVRRYYPEEQMLKKLREIEENFGSPDKCDVSELHMMRRTVILWSVTYWQQQINYDERDEATYWGRVWLLSEWGARKLKWAGDIAFTILISYKLGSTYEAWLSPLKDFIAETVGEMIASCWGESSSYEELNLMNPLYEATHITDITNQNTPVGKYARKFEDKLLTCFENLLSNLIEVDKMSTSFSISDKTSRTIFLKAGFSVAGLLLLTFLKTYYSMKKEERDCWKAFSETFSNLSQTAIKKIFASYVDKWMNSKTMQDFFKSKFMRAVNENVKGATKSNYTYSGKPLMVRYNGQVIPVKGQAIGNVDVGRDASHVLRLNCPDGKVIIIKNVGLRTDNHYLGYVEVISEILSSIFGDALEFEFESMMEKAEALDMNIISFLLDLGDLHPDFKNAERLYIRLNLKKIIANPASTAFDIIFAPIFGCLKLNDYINNKLMSIALMPINLALNSLETAVSVFNYLNNGSEVEQIDWSIFDESDGYKN